MDAALAALDRGVRALFAEPCAALAASSAHPLCECMLQHAPLPDWRYLQRFPVLKRHVLTQFRLVALEVEKQPQTPRKRKKWSVLQQSDNVENFRAVCVASLCQKLAPCGLLTLGDAEFVETLVAMETLDVLRRVVGGRLLPLRLRLLLLGFALQRAEKTALDAAEQSWIHELCEKILEEAREATATGGSKEPPSKRVRTRSGDKKDAGAEKEEEEKLCGFCRDGATAESLRSKSGGWEFLVECTHRVAKLLEKSGESYATNEAMVALSAFWDSLPVAGLASGRSGRRRKRADISVTSEDGGEPSLSLAAYERIVHVVVGSAAGVSSASGELNTFQVMWKNVWEREFMSMANEKQITLADAIRHCSKADAFASVLLLKKGGTHLPGYGVVVEAIRSLSIDVPGIITAFAHVWRASETRCRGGMSRIAIPINSGASSAKRILRSYLSELLKSSNVQQEGIPSSSDDSDPPTRVPPLELLSVLYEIFSEPAPVYQQINSYSRHWDALLTQISGVSSANEPDQDGINWLLNLEQCVFGIDSKDRLVMLHGSHFSEAFQSYCLTIMHGILATGGEIISGGGAMNRRLIGEENDRSTIRRGLTHMMAIFGDDWISSLIAELLRTNTNLRSTEGVHQRGVKSLLFPALVTSMKSNSQVQQKTGQQQFIDVVHAVNTVLKESEPSPLYLLHLMRFCEAWDVYQSTHTKEPPTSTNKWGIRAMIELDMLPELLDCYGRDDVVRQETREALSFAAEVLQNGSNCPPPLEGLLYKVISALKGGAESAKNSILGPLAATDKQLISHSSDVLQRLLQAVNLADLAQTCQLINQVKDAAGTLRELKQQLERWFSFVEMHGAAFAGRESRMELAVLCTRLIRWFPDEFESMRLLLMTPLDSHLVFALTAFVKEAGRTSSSVEQKSFRSLASSLPAAVRVEMALHLYLSAAAFPDLETLTTLLTKAMVKCRSADAFSHLAKVAQKNASILLPEAAIGTLSSPLRGLEFSATGANHLEYEDDDDAQMKDYTRRAKSIIYQENALKLLAMSASIFGGGISWSTVLFGGQAAVIWLPYFFEYILKTDFCEGLLRVDLLLSCLEELARDKSEKAVKKGFWIAALLNTALVACLSRSTGAYEDSEDGIHNRLQAIAQKLLGLLSIASGKTFQPIEDAGGIANVHHDAILILLNMSKCGWVILEEDYARWSSERLIDKKTATSLRITLSGSAMEAKEDAAAVESPIQLFVPFVHWLSAALVYSQSFLEEPSTTMRRWERTFTSYVTDLYLRLQFEDDACSLLKAWLSSWVSSNIVRGQEELQLLALLPSQVALFRRLGLTPYRSSFPRVRDRVSTSIWQLVFVAINLAVDHNSTETPASLDQATELVVSTLTTLELVELSASSDFVDFRHMQEIEPFVAELGQFLSRPQLRACSAAQVFCLLQYPLELLVCCYACKIPAEFEAESQLFLQRVQEVLHENFVGELSDGTTEFSIQEAYTDVSNSNAPSSSSVVDSAEMDVFLKYWADEMLLKYDYIDRERCGSVLVAIQAALQGVQ